MLSRCQTDFLKAERKNTTIGATSHAKTMRLIGLRSSEPHSLFPFLLALDESQKCEADSGDRLLCRNLNIIYLSARISVQPTIRVDAVIRKGWAACNWPSKKSCPA